MIIINQNNKKVLIIVLMILSVLLCIILCFLHIFKTIKNNSDNSVASWVEESDIERNPYSYNVQEVLTVYGCKNINKVLRKESEDNDTTYNYITLEFKYNLYEKGESQEAYFNKIVKTLTTILEHPFELVDKSKGIDIYVDKENDLYTINGIENYFSNNSYLEVNNHKETKAINGMVYGKDLMMIMSNDWNFSKINMNRDAIEVYDDYSDYGDIKIYSNNKSITNIVYTKEHEDEIIENITVGTDFAKIESELGKPTYKYENKMIGYKNEFVYLFFYEDEVSIYPRSTNYINSTIEKNIVNYYKNSKSIDQAIFIRDLIYSNNDFKSEIIDDYVKVSSPLRGIDLYFYEDGSFKGKIYDNYSLAGDIKSLVQSNIIETDYDNDSICLHEIERVFK